MLALNVFIKIIISYSNSINFNNIIILNLNCSETYMPHIRLSTIFHKNLLLDLFSYISLNINSYILSYIFANIITNNILTIKILSNEKGENPISMENKFLNSWWLEREVGEMHPLTFKFKSDTRNLLLGYSDSQKPLKKHFPSVGLYDLYYCPKEDSLVIAPVNKQT